MPPRNVLGHDPITQQFLRPEYTSSPARRRVVMDGPLAPENDSGIDTAVLPGLLARLGPTVAVDLRRQLGADLQDLRQTLGATLGPPPDMVAVARQTHGLIALAGTAGASLLTARARTLLRAAQRGDAAASLRLGSAILPQIDTLMAFVAACPLPADRTPP
jgi:hypothetical protein